MLQIIRTFLAWTFTGIYWPAVFVLDLLCMRRLLGRYSDRVIRFWGVSLTRILGIRITYLNPCPYMDISSRIIIPNHQSALDLVWGAMICPPRPLAIGKKEVAFIPFLNVAWWALKFILIDRKNSQKAIAAMQGVATEILKNKRSLLISPEGTRTSDGSILPFKKGAFHIAIEGKIPIYPVVVSGAYELLNRKQVIPQAGEIKIQFLDPIPTDRYTLETMNELIELVRGRMIAAYQSQINQT